MMNVFLLQEASAYHQQGDLLPLDYTTPSHRELNTTNWTRFSDLYGESPGNYSPFSLQEEEIF